MKTDRDTPMKEREQNGLEERLAGIFQPDTLLPSQFFDRARRRMEFDGERRLMIAVLEDAVDVYRKQAAATDARSQQLFRDAEDWIEETDRSWLFSFENICDVLDIDAGYIRRGLRTLKRGRCGQVVSIRAGGAQELRQASGD